MKFRSPQNIFGGSQQNSDPEQHHETSPHRLHLFKLLNEQNVSSSQCTLKYLSAYSVTGFYSNHSVTLLNKIS